MNFEYGVWNDFRWNCFETKEDQDVKADLVVTGTKFFGHHREALYNFFYFASPGDAIF